MNPAIIRFALFFGFVSFLICTINYRILKRRLNLVVRASRLLLAFFTITGILMFIGPLLYRGRSAPVDTFSSESLQFSQYFLMGFSATLMLVLILAEVLQAIWQFINHRFGKKFDPSKRIFLTEGVVKGLVAGTTLATFGGLLEAEAGPKVENVTIKLKTLPTSFDGLTIAQISDVHIGPLLHGKFLDGVVDQVLALDADIIIITGDLVDGSVEQLRPHVEALRRLRAREGVYFCTGNHEYYAGADEWIAYLESMGIHVFKNTNKIFKRQHEGAVEHLMLAGVYDFQALRFSGLHKHDAFAAAKSEVPVDCKILLAHNPYSINEAAAAGFNLQLSGHTHAGQFYPFAWIAKLYLKHFEGLYQINEHTQLYVNRGTGYWGPPNRLGKRGEITHYRLVSK